MSATNEPLHSTANLSQFQNSSSATDEVDSYDSYGAMLFIVAVILVYGVAVIGMLGFYSGRGEQMEDFDKQANMWLKEFEVRQRQLDIKSRKSVFAKRLSELRTDLSGEHGPRLHSHVASYLIASIGMKSRTSCDETKEKCSDRQKLPAISISEKNGIKRVCSEKEDLSSTNSPKLIPIIRVSPVSSSSNIPASTWSMSENAILSDSPAMSLSATYKYSRCPVNASPGTSVCYGTNSEDSVFKSPGGSARGNHVDKSPFNHVSQRIQSRSSRFTKSQGNKSMLNEDEQGELLSGVYVEYESVV